MSEVTAEVVLHGDVLEVSRVMARMLLGSGIERGMTDIVPEHPFKGSMTYKEGPPTDAECEHPFYLGHYCAKCGVKRPDSPDTTGDFHAPWSDDKYDDKTRIAELEAQVLRLAHQNEEAEREYAVEMKRVHGELREANARLLRREESQ